MIKPKGQPATGQPASQQSRLSWLFEQRDASSLVFFRVAFSTVMLWHVYWFCSDRLVETFYVTPAYHLTYHGFEWANPLPGIGMRLVFYAMGLAAAGIGLGLFYRLSCVLFFLTFTYTFLAESALFQNHYYLVCLLAFCLIWIPANRFLSLDALIWPQRASRFVPAWCYWLLGFQIAVPYVYGGIAKLDGDWLHGMPVGLWIEERSDLPLVGRYLKERWCAWLVSYMGLVLDLLIVPLLLWRRTRLVSYLVLVVFHVSNSILFTIDFFPWFMILATLILFPPDWPRKLLRLPAAGLPTSTPLDPQSLSLGRKVTVGFLAVYVAWQVLFPFRHFLYPGNPSWTEQGHLFAWRMMLRRKEVYIRFYATDRQSGQTLEIPIDLFLNPRQIQAMAVSADQIVAIAPYLKNEVVIPYLESQPQLQDNSAPQVEIRVLALASLNGRNPQLMVDPDLDLTTVQRTWRDQPWIIPLREPLREDAWRGDWIIPIDELPELMRSLQPPGGRTPRNTM